MRYHAVAISFVHRTISQHAAHVAVSFESRYRFVAISFVHRTISQHAAHVAVSFVSRYRFVAISFVHRTISQHAAHVAVSFVSRYRFVAISFVHRTISQHAGHVAVSFVSRYRSSSGRFRSMQLMSLYRLCRDIVRPPDDFATCSSCRCIVCVAISFVHRTISQHAAHVAVSFVSRYRFVAISFGYHRITFDKCLYYF